MRPDFELTAGTDLCPFDCECCEFAPVSAPKAMADFVANRRLLNVSGGCLPARSNSERSGRAHQTLTVAIDGRHDTSEPRPPSESQLSVDHDLDGPTSCSFASTEPRHLRMSPDASQS